MSENFPINPSSISYSDIKKDLTDWLQTLPDSEQWTLFFESSTGQQIVELVSALYAMTKFDNVVARREAYIQFAKNRSSKVGSAQFLGYSVYRGQNPIVEVTIVPNGTGVWEKGDIIGTVKDKDLLVIEPTVHNSGVAVTLQCVVGEKNSQEITCNTDSLYSFRFTEGMVSEHVRIFIDGDEIEHTREVSGLLEGKFQLQTNSFGSVDAKYLNLSSFTKRYGIGSVIKLEWVELADTDFKITDVKIDELEGTLSDVTIVSLYKEPETNDSITINAPLHNETKMNVRGKKDQAKVLRQLDDNIISAEATTISNGIMEIFYILENDERYSPSEVEQLIEDFEPYRPHGLMPPIITAGRRARRKLSFKIVREPNTTGDILATISDVVSKYEYQLGATINLYDIESELEQNNFIKIARVTLTATTWENDFPYEIGDMIKLLPDNGRIYEVIKHVMRSGDTEPVWPEFNEQTIEDNDLVWQTFIKSDTSEIAPWQANTEYSLYSRVKPVPDNGFAYKVIGFIHRSGSAEPTWPTTIGETIADNGLLWKCKELVGTPDEWQSNNKYKVGDVVIPVGGNGKMYQVYTTVRNSGDTIPSFPTDIEQTIVDGSVVWECKDPNEIEQELNPDQYYIIETETTVS